MHPDLTSQIIIKSLSKEFGKIIINSENIDILQVEKKLIIELFKYQGILLFRGFKARVDRFVEFSESLSKDFMDYSGGVFFDTKRDIYIRLCSPAF